MDRHTLHNHLRRQHEAPPEYTPKRGKLDWREYLATCTNKELAEVHMLAHANELINQIPGHTHPKEG
jgi:hypothetical protein